MARALVRAYLSGDRDRLELAGVDTVLALARRNAENLHKELLEAAEANKNVVRRAPAGHIEARGCQRFVRARSQPSAAATRRKSSAGGADSARCLPVAG